MLQTLSAINRQMIRVSLMEAILCNPGIPLYRIIYNYKCIKLYVCGQATAQMSITVDC